MPENPEHAAKQLLLAAVARRALLRQESHDRLGHRDANSRT
jgi:hypothetical protein